MEIERVVVVRKVAAGLVTGVVVLDSHGVVLEHGLLPLALVQLSCQIHSEYSLRC